MLTRVTDKKVIDNGNIPSVWNEVFAYKFRSLCNLPHFGTDDVERYEKQDSDHIQVNQRNPIR